MRDYPHRHSTALVVFSLCTGRDIDSDDSYARPLIHACAQPIVWFKRERKFARRTQSRYTANIFSVFLLIFLCFPFFPSFFSFFSPLSCFFFFLFYPLFPPFFLFLCFSSLFFFFFFSFFHFFTFLFTFVFIFPIFPHVFSSFFLFFFLFFILFSPFSYFVFLFSPFFPILFLFFLPFSSFSSSFHFSFSSTFLKNIFLLLCRSTRLSSTSPRNRSTSSNVRRAGALVPPPSCLGGGPHGWVPVYTHSTPVLTSVRRLWLAQATPRAQHSADERVTQA